MLQADIQAHPNNMSILKFGLEKVFLSRKPHNILIILLYCMSVCPCFCSLHLLNHLTECQYMLRHTFKGQQSTVSFSFLQLVTTTWPVPQICESIATQAWLTWGKSINVYGPCYIILCLQWYVSKLQGEGKVTLRLSYVGVVFVFECQWMKKLIKCNWIWREKV